MTGVILKHSYSESKQDEHVGNAIDSVLDNPPVKAVLGTLHVAIFSDVMSFGLKIRAIAVFLSMVRGRQDVNVSLITYLWLSATIINTLVKEISFIFAGIADRKTSKSHPHLNTHSEENLSQVNDSSGFAFTSMRLLSVASTICLFFRYTAILQAIVDRLDSRTALFDLYYISKQSFEMPAGSLTVDFLLLTLVVLFSTNGLIAQMFFDISSYPFKRFIAPILYKSPTPSRSGDANFIALFTRRFNDKRYANFITFETLIFPIFVMVVRAIYRADHVEFFHQLLLKIPIFFYVCSFIAGPLSFCFILGWCCLVLTCDYKEKMQLIDYFSLDVDMQLNYLTLYGKFFLLLIGTFLYKEHLESDPLWAIQVFLGTLIFEKAASLVIALGRAILSITNEKQGIALEPGP